MKDRYRLIERLGVGGSSVVWRAHDELLQRDVAVKVPSAAAGRQPALLDRIRQEARSAAALRHPNVVDVYDYDEERDQYGDAPVPYVVMELVEGRTLAQVLADGPLPWQTAVRICAQVASALAAAHERGIVHRDVKPGNVMVPGHAGAPEGGATQTRGAAQTHGAAQGSGAARGLGAGHRVGAARGFGAAQGLGAMRGFGAAQGLGAVRRLGAARGQAAVFGDGVKLVDFGISAAAGSVDEIDGEVLGTPAYLAPERLDGGPVRAASDVYGLGLLLYRALAGSMPWQATTITEMVSAHLREEPRPLPPLPGLPRAVADLVRRCLAKVPEARPDAAEAAWILADAAGMLPRRALHFPKPVSGSGVRRLRSLAGAAGRPAGSGDGPGSRGGAPGSGRRGSGGSVRGSDAAGPGRRRGGASRGGVRRAMSTTVAAMTLGILMMLRAPSDS
ncbi:serine/threonine-protein kinase [Actinoplanes sp. RD1]|uniref:serine/threonine-protein kinase n=1 Tax=Actinoplanes sp. RD1 TaxID=3064538 RepID=UPI002740F6C1|nr:serine/threonine-protein kinase [Actinoplanes sp. RD1]